METNHGVIIMELYPQKAPKMVRNFLRYVREGFYDGTIFHFIVKRLIVQGGAFSIDMQRKPAGDPIRSEADNGLKNLRGTVTAAHMSGPHSATSEFFINVRDNPFLDHKEKTSEGWGYCVFGKVVQGMNVVDAIISLPTEFLGKTGLSHVPTPRAVIKKAVVEE